MSEFVIDKSVPVPTGLAKRNTKYPFADMEIGDSFVTNGGERGTHNARTAMSQWAIRHQGYAFVTRREGDNVRVWRIAKEEVSK